MERGGSSPRWRGRLLIHHTFSFPLGLIPALAGTTSARTGRPLGRAAHPRAGGDDGGGSELLRLDAGSSPRWRGRRPVRPVRLPRPGLIPALAGTTQCNLLPYPTNLPNRAGSSPRWRGRLVCDLIQWSPLGLIPALAGTTLSVSIVPIRMRAHPRAGGDDTSMPRRLCHWPGSSPRWRGRRVPSSGNSDAYWAHPRAGGDDAQPPCQHVRHLGSSPRWRGRLWTSTSPRTQAGLIPALAGTTRPWGTVRCASWAHPRAGGDDNNARHPASSRPGSSPRWRGRHSSKRSIISVSGLIPALAGTTSV